jgi:hypothetical protein
MTFKNLDHKGLITLSALYNEFNINIHIMNENYLPNTSPLIFTIANPVFITYIIFVVTNLRYTLFYTQQHESYSGTQF